MRAIILVSLGLAVTSAEQLLSDNPLEAVGYKPSEALSNVLEAARLSHHSKDSDMDSEKDD